MLRLYKHHSFLMSHNEWTLPHFRDSQLVFPKKWTEPMSVLDSFLHSMFST